MKVNVVSRSPKKMIKPCKPTPSHLNPYKISMMDEINTPMHVIRIIYYAASDDAGEANHDVLLERLLAQVLPHFYPLAGRYNREKNQVDCNDKGSGFCVADVDCKLDQLIGNGVKSEQVNPFLPQEIGAVDELTDPMLSVQINRFQCGGLAIGVCASHRIFDSCSLGVFLTAWANTATKVGLVNPPVFDCPLYFSPENKPMQDFGMSRTSNKSILAKSYIFDKNAISRLRERVGAEWRKTGNVSPPIQGCGGVCRVNPGSSAR